MVFVCMCAWAICGASAFVNSFDTSRIGVAQSVLRRRAAVNAVGKIQMSTTPSRRTLLKWLHVAATGASSSSPAAAFAASSFPVQKSEEEWAQSLTDQQNFILREGGACVCSHMLSGPTLVFQKAFVQTDRMRCPMLPQAPRHRTARRSSLRSGQESTDAQAVVPAFSRPRPSSRLAQAGHPSLMLDRMRSEISTTA